MTCVQNMTLNLFHLSLFHNFVSGSFPDRLLFSSLVLFSLSCFRSMQLCASPMHPTPFPHYPCHFLWFGAIIAKAAFWSAGGVIGVRWQDTMSLALCLSQLSPLTSPIASVLCCILPYDAIVWMSSVAGGTDSHWAVIIHISSAIYHFISSFPLVENSVCQSCLINEHMTDWLWYLFLFSALIQDSNVIC